MADERPEEALKLVEEVLSQAKQEGDLGRICEAQMNYVIIGTHRQERYEETFAMATELLESARTLCRDSSNPAYVEVEHLALDLFATSCGMTGRFDESKRAFAELIASCTRVFGRDHEKTRDFFRKRAILLRKMVGTAGDLVSRYDRAEGTRYLDAFLIESKARDLLDAEDPDIQINYKVMVVAATVLAIIGRKQESLAMISLCLKSARERKDLDSEPAQRSMRIYARVSYDLHGFTKERKEVLGELLAIRTRLYGPDAPQTQATATYVVAQSLAS